MTGLVLDPVIHSQARLRVMTTLTALAPGDLLTFPRLLSMLDLTAGNLSIHLRKLEEAGYVEVRGGPGRQADPAAASGAWVFPRDHPPGRVIIRSCCGVGRCRCPDVAAFGGRRSAAALRVAARATGRAVVEP